MLYTIWYTLTIDVLTFEIDRSLDDPVYQQIADQVRRYVASGSLNPGTVLPSVRQLAGNLGVSLNTIARAYRRLEDEGFLVIQNRAGVRVVEPARDVEESARARLMDELGATLARLRQAGMDSDEILSAVRREVRALGAGESRRWRKGGSQ